MKKLLITPFIVFLFQMHTLSAQELVMLTPKTSNAIKEVSTINTPAAKVFEFDIYSKIETNKDVAPELVGTHFLGEETAKKMYLLDKLYMSEKELAPGNPATTTTLRKPTIYKSVKKIESYLKKSIRKKEISTEQADVEFNKVVDVAINVIYLNTEDLENQIKKIDQPSDLLSLYTERVHLNFIQ